MLALADPDLARVVEAFGYPPLWDRPPGFPTLVYIVLEQQVSLASARAAFDRLAAAGPVTPETFLRLSDTELHAIGFSRQKTAYCRGLAAALASSQLDLAAVDELDDDEARFALTQLKGIGPWTADIYLLMVLCGPTSGRRGTSRWCRRFRRSRALTVARPPLKPWPSLKSGIRGAPPPRGYSGTGISARRDGDRYPVAPGEERMSQYRQWNNQFQHRGDHRDRHATPESCHPVQHYHRHVRARTLARQPWMYS